MVQQPRLNNQQLPSDAPGAPRAQSSMAQMALEFIKNGDVIGLGTGRAATAFVRALGDAVKAGLRVTAVSTSEVTAALAAQLGCPPRAATGPSHGWCAAGRRRVFHRHA